MSELTNGLAVNGFSEESGASKFHLKEFIFRYLRFLPWILLCALIATVVAFIKIRYSTPIYHTQASLLINSDQGNTGGDQRLGQLFLDQGNVNLSNEIQILQSRPVLQRVIKKLNLDLLYYSKGKIRTSLCYPESPVKLNILSRADSSLGFGFSFTILNNNQFLVGKSTTPLKFGDVFEFAGNHIMLSRNMSVGLGEYSSPEFAVNLSTVESAAGSLIGGLKIAQGVEQSTILTLSFDAENMHLARDILNTLMAVYDTMIVEDKRKIANSTIRFIKNSLKALNDTLGNTEDHLRDFQTGENVFDITGQSNSYLSNITENTKAVSSAQLSLSVLDFLEKYLRDNNNNFQLVPNNLGIADPVLLQLMTEYNKLVLERNLNLQTTQANNPLILGMETSMEKMRQNMLQALSNLKQQYIITLDNIDSQTKTSRGQLKSMPGKSMKLMSMQRQQKIFEDLYSFLLQKSIETNMASASTVSNSRVIEPALSSGRPISPDTKTIYFISLMIGIAIPVGLIALSELMRDKISNRQDVEKATHAPILGEIGHSGDKQQLVVVKNSRRFIAEQFRIVRSNLQYITGKKENPTIMVTSSFSGEGKSFISTNIGAVMSLAGKKTVIMEFDIRKPKIVVGLELKRNMGITNFIIGRANFEELPIKVPGMENLFVIPCGPIPPNPSELLLDSKLDELMKLAKENYEVVIMDTAPMGLVSDAATLGKYADCTLYIVRQGHTYRKQMGMVEDLYVNKKLPSIALLLNDVKTGGGYGYGGYGYGGYGYGGYGYGGYGYGAESGYFEEESSKKKRAGFFKSVRRRIRKVFR